MTRCATSSKTEHGRKIHAQRKITIEPVYGQIKHNRGITAFMRRQGRGAVRVAVGGSHPQSAQAPQRLDSQHRLTAGHDGHPSVPQSGSATGRRDPALSGYSDGLVA